MFRALLLLLLGIGFCLRAQTGVSTDSLIQQLKNPDLDGEKRISVYRELGRATIDVDPKTAILYFDSALVISSNGEYVASLPTLLLYKGLAFRRQNLHGEALRNYNEGLRIAIDIGDKSSESRLYMELAVVAEMTGEMAKALDLNQKALDINVALSDTVNIVTIYNNIGVIYLGMKERAKAMSYYRKAVELNELAGRSAQNARIINNMGLVYQETNQIDSALICFNKALSLIDKTRQKYGYALLNNNLGIAYRANGEYDRAIACFNIAKALQLELNDQYGLALVNDNISQVYFKKGDYRESIRYLTEAQPYAERANNLQLLGNIEEHRANAFEKLGDFRNALYHQQQAKVYDDSAQVKGLSNEVAELEVKYQVKQQQAEIELLKSENELHLVTGRNRNIIILASTVLSLLVLIMLALAYRNLRTRKKANAIVQEKNEKLESLYEEVEHQRKSIELQKAEIEMQNEELSKKNRYLNDLNHEKNSLMGIVAHDLNSPLNSIGGIADMLPRLGPLNEPQQEFVTVITKVVASGRELVRDVMDLSALENRELKIHPEPVSINALLEECKLKFGAEALRKSISLNVTETTDENLLVTTDRSHITRVLQNLISNALKFSHSGTTVKLGARCLSNTLMVFVSDEGPGISPPDQKLLFRKFMKLSARPTGGESSTGLGLSIVKALLEELGGSITVDSVPGKGTRFTCVIPVDRPLTRESDE